MRDSYGTYDGRQPEPPYPERDDADLLREEVQALTGERDELLDIVSVFVSAWGLGCLPQLPARITLNQLYERASAHMKGGTDAPLV